MFSKADFYDEEVFHQSSHDWYIDDEQGEDIYPSQRMMNKIGGLDEFMADKTTIIASSLKDDEVWSVPPGYRIKEDSNVHKL